LIYGKKKAKGLTGGWEQCQKDAWRDPLAGYLPSLLALPFLPFVFHTTPIIPQQKHYQFFFCFGSSFHTKKLGFFYLGLSFDD
jgi:hypothetical protein